MRGVSLRSQMAVVSASEADAQSVEETREFLRASLSKMSAREMTRLFYKHASGLLATWPFGTVVQHVNLDVRAIVLTDDGATCEVMGLKYHEVIETDHSVWAPVEG